VYVCLCLGCLFVVSHNKNNTLVDEPLCENCEIVELRVPPFTVPPGTTYACFAYAMPRSVVERGYHALRVDAIRSSSLLHHMQLMTTTRGARIVDGRACHQVARDIVGVWSHNEPRTFGRAPSDVSMPLSQASAHVDGRPINHAAYTVGDAYRFANDNGDDDEHNEVIVVEMHYTNEANKRGELDESGFKLYLGAPRAHVADVVMVGSMLAQGIPPARAQVTITGFCALPFGVQPLSMFAVQPHMHRRGVRMSVFVATPEQPDDMHNTHFKLKRHLLRDEPFDFGAIHSVVLEQPVVWGVNELMVVECTYDTTHDAAPVRWGYGVDREMCFAILQFSENVPGWSHCVTKTIYGKMPLDRVTEKILAYKPAELFEH
jgi:hypothetical protein